MLYLSSLIRCTIALHNLVNNKIKYRELEELGTNDKKESKKETADKDASSTSKSDGKDKDKKKDDTKSTGKADKTEKTDKKP